MLLQKILGGGLSALLDYLSAHVLTCLVPAFFIAGGIAVFVSQTAVMKYFGAQAKKWVAYSVASVSGTILAVCSCTILPLFGGIYKRGAGLGPATAFLYSGPAINVLAIVYTARLLGFELGLARALGAISFSIIIGLIMAWLWRKEETVKNSNNQMFILPDDQKPKHGGITILYFSVLVGILIFGAAKKWIITGILLVSLGIILYRWYKKEELKEWMFQTWDLFKKVFPILLVGVFIAGMLKVLVPESVITKWLGGNSLTANLLASVFGALFYFSTLTEVPIIKALLDLGMGKGPALALLLAGPALSLPSMIVLIRLIGFKKTLAYVILVVVMSTITGMLFGVII
ncbi:MAG: permease [bacterium]|nr:permease [bacterium]